MIYAIVAVMGIVAGIALSVFFGALVRRKVAQGISQAKADAEALRQAAEGSVRQDIARVEGAVNEIRAALKKDVQGTAQAVESKL